MASSSSTFSDCSQTDGSSSSSTTTAKGESPMAEEEESNEDNFLNPRAATQCDHETGVVTTAATYSSDEEEEEEQQQDLEKRSSEEEDAAAGPSKSVNASMGLALQNNVKAWFEETRLPANVTVLLKDCSFQLHKYPLTSRSGFLKRALVDAKEVRIPSCCPGGPQIFEIVANFCYGSTIEMEPSNVAELRCASEYLQMNEENWKGNLCERSDLYLTQVALQSWQDTMVVLLQCQSLHPFAEDLRIVSRCIESLAYMACVEMVDPLERTSRPGMSFESQFWSDISASSTTRDSSSPDWWMDDLVRLPCNLFERVIAAIRREGMQEKYVSQAIVKFVDRWVFSSPIPEMDAALSEDRQFKQNESDLPSKDDLMQTVVRLLPPEKDAVPISFLFSLLRCVLAWDSSSHCKDQLESRIASQLELATISDFLQPFKVPEEGCISAAEVSCMKRIVNSFMAQQRSFSDSSEALPSISSAADVPENFYCAYAVSAVAKVWDEYLAEVARDLTLTPTKFSELEEVVPSFARATHDHLYKAIHVYLKVHPHFSQEERQLVCRILNCHKLSPEMCTHAVQNELMPLRMIVQAMFMQQIQTRNVLSGHLQYGGPSLRFEALPPLSANGASFHRNGNGQVRTESFRSTRESFRSPFGRRDSFGGESFRREDQIADDGSSLGYILKRDAAFRQAALLKADYKATETRLQNLEEELASMKKKMDGGHAPVGKPSSEKAHRKKRKVSLTAVPEVSISDADNDAEVGDVNLAARSGNGVGFLAKVLRLVTLGGYRKRKVDSEGDSPAAESNQTTQHILCGGRDMWRGNVDPAKSKISARSLGFHNYSCYSPAAVQVREPRRLPLS